MAYYSTASVVGVRVATVSIASRTRYPLVRRNTQRFYDLENILKTPADLYVLPGGYFCSAEKASRMYSTLKELKSIVGEAVICVGVDGEPRKPWPKDQTAIAIDETGIIAVARKFAPAPKENVIAAASYLEKERGKPRIFTLQGKSIYLGVCYDSFGIRHRNLKNPGVDIFLDHIHGFFPAGQGNSGESYFARHGLAGASKQWNVPVFGAAVFFNRPVPQNWPTGIYWNQGMNSTQHWNYEMNPLVPERVERNIKEGSATIHVYDL